VALLFSTTKTKTGSVAQKVQERELNSLGTRFELSPYCASVGVVTAA
jgi:hypothetical protein